MSAECDSCFGMLPVEMKTKIFSFLTFDERKKIRVVCPHWRAVINDKLKFDAVLSNKTEYWLSTLFKDLHIESLTIQNLTKIISMSTCKKAIPNPKNYTIGRGNSAQNLVNFLRTYCTEGQSLEILNLAFANLNSQNLFRILPALKWPSLSTLSIALGSMDVSTRLAEGVQNHIESIIPLIKSIQVHSLRNLTIKLDYADHEAVFGKNIHYEKPWLEILSFIIKHAKTLEELKISMHGKPNPPPTTRYKDLFASLEKLHLKNFEIEFDMIHASFATEFCQKIKNLEEIKIAESFWSEISGPEGSFNLDTDLFRVGDIIRMHSTTNTIRSIFCQCPCFDMIWLRHLVSLENLIIRTTHVGFIESTPYLPSLKRFGILNVYDSQIILPSLTDVIIERMPNLDVLELLFPEDSPFSRIEIAYILGLEKLRMLIVGDITDRDDIAEFCEDTPGLSCQFEARGPIEGVAARMRYDCAIICINR